MGRGSSEQRGRQQKEKKHKKEKKEKKDRDREREKGSRSRSRDKVVRRQEERQQVAIRPRRQEQQQELLPQKTHVSCRRCKENTFSLLTRTCSSCGYPKQSRPAYFPTTKQVQVLDLVRQGKLVHNSYAPVMIEVVVNDRMGKRQRIKCCPSDTVLQLKKLISAQIGTRCQKIRLQKANIIFKDHISLDDYEIKDGMGLQMYYD